MKLNVDQTLQQAINLHNSKKFEEAESLYREILKIEPTHPDANHNLGVLLVYLGKTAYALSLFKTATEVNPNTKQFWISYSDALIKEKKFEEAKVSCKKAIEFNPEHAESHFDLANLLNSLKSFKDAEISYKKTIELDPDFADAYNNLGKMLIKINNLVEAELNFKRLIELKPNYAEAYNNLGVILRKLTRLEEAELNYKKAIELNSDYAEAYNNLGNVTHKLKRLDEAEKSCKKAIELNSNFPEAHNNLGTVLQERGKIDDAKASYNKAIELKPNFRAALLNRGQISFDKGEFETALKDFDSCNTKDSRSRSLISLYALGRIKEIYQRFETQKHLDQANIRVSAFSSFIEAKEKKLTNHQFCKNPIDFIDITNLSSNIIDVKLFINNLTEELKNINTKWEPTGKTTHNGSQSNADLFTNASGNLDTLKNIILDEINFYVLKFNGKSCNYIKNWPFKTDLFAWQVILKQQGYQDLHIHPGGWLSGVIYLKVVPPLEKNEGAIEFSLNGKHYSDPNSPKLIHQPKEGDIIFFPSSLHHRTIPFTTETDRISIAFDLVPFS